MRRAPYLAVLGSVALCYAALGAVLRLLPDYVPQTLSGGAIAIGIAVGAPAIGAICSRPLGGRLADDHGPKMVVAAGALVMVVAGIPAVLIQQIGPLVASRLVVGFGEGFVMSAGVLWLLRLAGPERRGQAMGHIGLANYSGLAVGPLIADVAGGGAHPARVLTVSVLLPLGTVLLIGMLSKPGRPTEHEERPGFRDVVAAVWRPGLGNFFVNIGYAALIAFGPLAAPHGAGGLIVPLFAAGVIVTRTLGASIPDRIGARRTVVVFCAVAAAGLAAVAVAPSVGLVAGGTIVLAVGQALAVPALGVLAISGVPEAAHGAAAGTFFISFDLGVGLGGPLAGGAARATDPSGALVLAAVIVALAPLVSAARARRTSRAAVLTGR